MTVATGVSVLFAGWLATGCYYEELPRPGGTDTADPGRPDARPPRPESACPDAGPAVDLADLAACCADYGGAHCVAAMDVPADLQPRLDSCDSASLCVPDPFIVDGAYRPPACESIASAPGVCLSACIPEVATNAGVLPQADCAAAERCVPCINPVTQEPTGVCDFGPACTDTDSDEGADAGTSDMPDPPLPPARCCDDRGTCLPADVAGDRADALGVGTCAPDAGDVCVPDVFVDPAYVPPACETFWVATLFGDAYRPGRCFPDCMAAVDNFLLGQDTCAAGERCAPCLDPLADGAPSGACDDP